MTYPSNLKKLVKMMGDDVFMELQTPLRKSERTKKLLPGVALLIIDCKTFDAKIHGYEKTLDLIEAAHKACHTEEAKNATKITFEFEGWTCEVGVRKYQGVGTMFLGESSTSPHLSLVADSAS